MPSIRIPFPESSEPSAIKLQGSRITIGRLPFNTVQIIDRTISGFHAELILENGHYRLHDRGSTNGTFVNGELTTDFHLLEACKISFGTVECDFDPAAEEVGAGDEAVPTRGELNSVRQENAELRGLLAAVREQVATLLQAKPVDRPDQAVSRDEFMQVVAEREALKEAQLRHGQEVARLKGDLAVVRRDRDNLQKAWAATKAELAKVQPKIEAVAVVEVPAAAEIPDAPAEEPAALAEESAAPAISAPAPPVPARIPVAPVAPSRPSMPTARPVVPLPSPTGKPFPAPRPAGLPSPLVSAPTVIARSPMPAGSGVRPFPKAAPTVMPGAPRVPQPAGVAPKPAPGVLHPRPSVMPVHSPGAGPKGTQKIA